jgi:c-di-GMP-binding flagellar brake protein YcgR
MSKDPSLTVEKFRNGEENKYLIKSPREIQLTLKAVAQKKAIVVLHYNHDEHFIKTLLLEANETGIWVDVGPGEDINSQILNSNHVVFVTMHNGAKVQFDCPPVEVAIYASHPAFFFPLPAQMIRLQRRDYFRLPTSADTPLKCTIPRPQDDEAVQKEITIMDISVGGIALTCKESNVKLETGETYPDCQIELPGVGTLKVTIQVKNLFDVTAYNGVVTKHAGCEFIKLDGKTSILLQRYIATMQSKLSR